MYEERRGKIGYRNELASSLVLNNYYYMLVIIHKEFNKNKFIK